MIVIVSPAKTMQVEQEVECTPLPFPYKTKLLVKTLQSYPTEKLQTLMKISAPIAQTTFDRFQTFTTAGKGSYALEAYQGIQFQQLQNHRDKMAYANKHIRIVSGLYGLLKPYDVIQAYRLEMQCKLKVQHAKHLYEFWQETLSVTLQEQLQLYEKPVIVNLASKEYSKAFLPSMQKQMLTIDFVEVVEGKDKRNSMTVKKLRGQMLNFILQHQIDQVHDLQTFVYDGFHFAKDRSSNHVYTFIKC
ncbi:hypothetical protein A4S06_09055 [Erysipelotrichaceae bacterium MTC7]|nr:hypothetical protein A4S06_09055 [Erysipelotrichaceae bacterium MTC7]